MPTGRLRKIYRGIYWIFFINISIDHMKMIDMIDRFLSEKM